MPAPVESDVEPEPATDQSFRTSVTRHAGAGVGLVVLVAAVFWMIGSFGGDDDDIPVVADEPIDDPQPADDPDPTDDPDPGPVAGTHDRPVDDLEEPNGDSADDQDGDSADAEVEDEPETSDEDTDEDTDEDPNAQDDGNEEPATPAIDPATISVQVLDGYQEDGGAAAAALAAELDEAGYNIVARNPALRYDQTAVLWTAGHEDEGRQVAAAIGAAEVRQQPGNLSTQVAVHVVVGADRG